MLRNIVRLVVLGLVVHAAVRIGPEFWHFLKFKDGVTEIQRPLTRVTLSDR